MSDKEALKAEAKAAKEREKERHQIDKYKSQFLDTSSNLTTRTKALIKLFEIECDAEIGVYFREHYALVFSALSDTSNSLENTSRKGKHVSDKDIKNTIEFIKKIIIHLQQDLQDPRNNKILLTTLERFLYIENAHFVRIEAFRALLMLIEVLPGNPEALKIMMSSLNLAGYIGPEYAGQQFALPPSLSAGEKTLIFMPSPTGPSTRKESMEIFDELLKFAERTPEKFVFWLGIVNAIIAHVFPEAAARAGIEGANPEIGFSRGSSPPDLQMLIFQHLITKWMKDDRYLSVFAPDVRTYGLIFDFFGSAMALPLQTHLEVARLFLKEAFTFFVLQKKVPPNMTAQEFVGFQEQTFDITASVFRSGHSKDCKELVTLCRDILWLYSQCLNMYTMLPQNMRKKLLYTILATAKNLLTIPHTNVQLVDTLKNEVLSILLNSWVTNMVTDKAMWADFHRTIEPLMLHTEVVTHLRIKMMHLTLTVKELCYTPSAAAAAVTTTSAGAQPPSGGGGGGGGGASSAAGGKADGKAEGKAKKEKAIWSLDTRESVEKSVLRDTALSMIQWDRKVLLDMWNSLFCTFANVTNIKDARTFESVVRIIVDSMDLLIQAEDASVLSPSEEERAMRIPLLQTYAEILFAVCLIVPTPTSPQQDVRLPGIAICYGALCRLFCRRFSKLPLRLLAQWYAAIKLGLRSHQRVVFCAIVDNAYSVFTYELEGAAVIIPDVIDAFKAFLAPNENGGNGLTSTSTSSSSSSSSSSGIPLGTRRKAVSLVASLIGLPHHFSPMALSTQQGGGGGGSGSSSSSGATYTSAQLRADVRGLLEAFAGQGQLDSEARIMALWALLVLVHEEFAHFGGEAATGILSKLLAVTETDNYDVARASLQILADLACFAPRLAPNIVNDIVDSSCQVILSQKATEAIMVEAYLCVMSWLVGANVPSAWITEKTQDKIVNAIKVGKLYGSVPQDSIAVTIGAATGGGAGSGDSAGSGSGGSGSGGSSNGGNGTSSPSTIVIGSSANGMSSSSSSSSLSSSGIGMGSVGGNGGGGDSSSMGGGSGGAGSSLTGSSGAQGQYSQPQSRRERVAERSKTLRRLKKSDPFGGRGSIGFSDRDRDDDDNGSSGGFSSSGGCGVGSGIGGIGGGGGGSIGGGVGACGSSVSPGPGGSSGAGGAGATGTVGAGMVISSGGISGVGGNSPRVGVRYAAEMLLECMLSFRGSYPFAEGPDVMGSLISEGDDGAREEHTTSFVYNKTNIISVADIPLNPTHIVYNAKTAVAPTGTTAARVIIREASGKWAWDFIPLHAPAETGLPEADLEFESGGAGDDDQQQQTSSGGRTGARREKTMMGQSFMLKQNNKLFDALLATEEANPELPTMINSTQVLDKFAGKVEETEALVAGLGAAEATVKTLYPSPLRECEPTPPEAAPAMTENTATRLLLQQLGFTSPVSAVAPLVERVQLGEKYKRSNAMFDKSPTRGVHKIGLIYVREGQETQNVILANSAGSPLYRDFVRGLGWTIDVTEHRGYLGGLDKSSSAGRTAVYWADALTEVIFHEVVAMPTSDTDHQQIHKKRHVGNDFVHVIWCEGLRDYDPLTITSQFNEAHIVIYPQEDGLCRVQVFRDLQNNIFGPLQHGMVVSKDILPALVRQTAINADNAITSRITPDPFKRPYATKRKMLNESVDRYVDTDFSYTKSVAEIIKGDLVEDPPQSGSSPSSSPASSSSQQLSASSSSSSSTSALPDPTQR